MLQIWSDNGKCFIAEWNVAASSEKAFYEARLTAYEARLRRMKRHCVPWSETFSGFMFFARIWAKKWSGYGDSNSGPFDPQSNALDQAALYPEPCSIIYHPFYDLSRRIFIFFWKFPVFYRKMSKILKSSWFFRSFFDHQRTQRVENRQKSGYGKESSYSEFDPDPPSERTGNKGDQVVHGNSRW